MNEFNVVVEHNPDSLNTAADRLSWAPRQESEVKEAMKCTLLTSWVIPSRRQIIEEQKKDLICQS